MAPGEIDAAAAQLMATLARLKAPTHQSLPLAKLMRLSRRESHSPGAHFSSKEQEIRIVYAKFACDTSCEISRETLRALGSSTRRRSSERAGHFYP